MHILYAHYFEGQIPLQNSNKFTDKKIINYPYLIKNYEIIR